MIPEAWETKALPDVCWFQEGPGLRQWQFTTTGMKVINVTNLEAGVLNLDRTDRYIGMSEFRRVYQHFAVDAGDIVMASSGNSYSKIAVVRSQDLPLVMNTSVIRFKPSRVTERDFLWALLNSALFKDQIDLMITGGAQPNFGPYHLKRVVLPVPLLSEQRAIAAALTDVDALIGRHERLIAKKRDLKQAAMQQLLTGERRLPGFRGDWEAKQFGDLFQFMTTANNPRADLVPFGDVGYIHYGDIHTTTSAFLDCAQTSVPSIAKELVAGIPFVEDGDLVVADASEDYSGIGKSVEVQNLGGRRVVAGLHTFLLRGNKELLADGFKGYLQFIPSVKAALVRFATGISVYGVSKNNLRRVEARLPKPDEQIAIATVLSDIDAEIAALEQRRDKTRDLKQGMMQELLTGRTRLV